MVAFNHPSLIKMIVSAGIVVALSLVADRAGPRVAGIVSGYPLGAAISLFFIALENGTAFAARSALFTTAGLSATVTFTGGYLLGIRLSGNRRRLSAITTSILLGLIFYFATVWLLSFFPINWLSAPLVTIAVICSAAWGFQNIPDTKNRGKLRLGCAAVLTRAGFAAIVILAVTATAGAVGPRWAGLFSAFPITMLPLLVIIQATYSPDHVATTIKNVPRGLGSLVMYCLAIAAAYPKVGVFWGTALGYTAATGYLVIWTRKNHHDL